MALPITEAYVMIAGKNIPKAFAEFIRGKERGTKKSHTVICVASKVYIPVRL